MDDGWSKWCLAVQFFLALSKGVRGGINTEVNSAGSREVL